MRPSKVGHMRVYPWIHMALPGRTREEGLLGALVGVRLNPVGAGWTAWQEKAGYGQALDEGSVL